MKLRVSDRLRLTLSNVGTRAVVSVNSFVVTEAAFVGQWTSSETFRLDVTRWLHSGENILAVVLIGEPEESPFRMMVHQSGFPDWSLDEDDMLPPANPWRFWSLAIERAADPVNGSVWFV